MQTYIYLMIGKVRDTGQTFGKGSTYTPILCYKLAMPLKELALHVRIFSA